MSFDLTFSFSCLLPTLKLRFSPPSSPLPAPPLPSLPLLSFPLSPTPTLTPRRPQEKLQSCVTFSNLARGDRSVASTATGPAQLPREDRAARALAYLGACFRIPANARVRVQIPQPLCVMFVSLSGIPWAWFVFLSGRLHASSSFSSGGLFSFTMCFGIGVWSFFFFFFYSICSVPIVSFNRKAHLLPSWEFCCIHLVICSLFFPCLPPTLSL